MADEAAADYLEKYVCVGRKDPMAFSHAPFIRALRLCDDVISRLRRETTTHACHDAL
jgi:hypothetical protein